MLKMVYLFHKSSAESQKGVNNVQRCSFENQKGTIALYSDSALNGSQTNHKSLNLTTLLSTDEV